MIQQFSIIGILTNFMNNASDPDVAERVTDSEVNQGYRFYIYQ